MKLLAIKIRILLLLIFATDFCCCNSGQDQIELGICDKHATERTKVMFDNLKKLSDSVVIYGNSNPKRSLELFDEYPGVFCLNIAHSDSFNRVVEKIEAIYAMGGLININMLAINPLTGESAYQGCVDVKQCLPGGQANAAYKDYLIKVSNFFKSLKVGQSDYIPIIVNVFKLHNGNDFWWSKKCSAELDYVNLWKYTVDFLKDSLDVHNVLYAYSSLAGNLKTPFIYAYPGNEYVDVLGMEMRFDGVDSMQFAKDLAIKLDTLVTFAKKNGKMAALTAVSLNNSNVYDWHSNSLLPAILQYDNSYISYLVAQENSDTLYNKTTNGRFKKNNSILFLDNLPDIYGKKTITRKNN